MDEKKRTRILAAVLGCVLVFMVMRPDRMLMRPIEEAQAKLRSAQSRYEKADARQMELLVAKERIAQAIRTSLPPRPSDALRLYQSWITNLAEQCRFAQLSVQPGNATPVRGQYATVDVLLEAETDLEGLSRFLYLFEQADLAHRITLLETESTGASGNPRLDVTLTAEGLSMASAPQRADIFPRTSLTQAAAPDDTQLHVFESADFPQDEPFLAQLGREMIRVTQVDDKVWTVERGLEGTTATAHPADEIIDMFPVSPLRRDITFENYRNLLQHPPFTKPAPPKVFRPRLTVESSRTIAPGDTVQITAQAEDINPDIGEIEFTLVDPIEGMTIDPKTGTIVWKTPEDIEPKKYTTTVVLTQKNNDELRLEKQISITVQLPNEAPTLKLPTSATVFLERPFVLPIEVADDGGEDNVTLSLEGDVPEGMVLEDRTIKWTPPRTFDPGEYTVTVKAQDSGTPAKSSTASVKLNVRDDDAAMTVLTASVTLDGTPVAWFRNIARNERPQLRVGDRIRAAEIDAVLREIAPRHVLIEDAEGIWRVDLGQNLRQRKLIEKKAETLPAEMPAETVPAEKTESDTGDATTPPPAPEAPPEKTDSSESSGPAAGEETQPTAESNPGATAALLSGDTTVAPASGKGE